MPNESLAATIRVVKKLQAAYIRTKDESLVEMIDTLLDVALQLAQEPPYQQSPLVYVPIPGVGTDRPPIIPDGIYVYAAPMGYPPSPDTITTDTIRVGDVNSTTDGTGK